MSKLSGKVAVVTGASKGIGAGIARALAADGASVVVNYASGKHDAERVVSEIQSAGGKAVAVQGDVAKPSEIERLFQQAKDAYGRVDILVNNAGVYSFTPLEQVQEAEFHRQFNINVLGLLLSTKEAVKLFPETGGSVINISSAVTSVAMPGSAIYTATKGAVDAVTRVLANELAGRRIRVNAISPGVVLTEGTQAAGVIGTELEQQLVSQTPLGRIGRTDDIAPVAVFLASDDARWLTGEIIFAAGGVQ